MADKIVVIASNQPPLCFYGFRILNKFFDECDEPYLSLTAYLVKRIDPFDARPMGAPDQQECVVIVKESGWVTEFDEQGRTVGGNFSNKKYLVLKHPHTTAHVELYEFCLQRENNVKTISGDFLEFLKELGRLLSENETFYFFNRPWEVAK